MNPLPPPPHPTESDPVSCLPWVATPAPPSIDRPATAARVEQALERLDHLQELLRQEMGYQRVEMSYRPPANFRLSIVIPVFNERQTVARLLARVHDLPLAHEMIVVDDDSTDGTRDVLRSLEDVAGLRVIYKPRNEGKGAAVRAGLACASGDVVLIQDADLEYDPRDIPQLIRPIIEGEADVVYGSRFLRQQSARGSSRLHQWGNRCLTKVSNTLTGLRLTDMETCYKAFRRELLRDLPLRENGFGFEPEITAKLARRGARFGELPIRYHARDWNEGKKIRFRDAANALYCIARYSLCD